MITLVKLRRPARPTTLPTLQKIPWRIKVQLATKLAHATLWTTNRSRIYSRTTRTTSPARAGCTRLFCPPSWWRATPPFTILQQRRQSHSSTSATLTLRCSDCAAAAMMSLERYYSRREWKGSDVGPCRRRRRWLGRDSARHQLHAGQAAQVQQLRQALRLGQQAARAPEGLQRVTETGRRRGARQAQTRANATAGVGA